MSRAIAKLTTALVVALGAAPAAAEELSLPEARQGYYLGGGMKLGLLSIATDARGDLGGMMHFGGELRLGQMVFPWLGFGAVFGGGSGKNEDWATGFGGLSLEAQLRLPDTGFSLRLGVGIGGQGVSRVDEALASDADPSGGAGALYSLGVSFDWFPFYDRADGDRSGGFSLTPYLEAQLLPLDGVTTFAVVFGVESFWWSGLPDEKLELPPEEAFRRR